MAIVKTNNISLAYAVESSLGTLPGSPVWYVLEPNDITTFGATITTVAREPISKDRGRRKGTVTDLESAAEFEHDMTLDAFISFAEGFAFATFQGDTIEAPTDVAAATDTFTVGTGPTLEANQLVFARGFTNSANNGVHEVASGTATTIVVTTALTDEAAPPANALLEAAGLRFETGELALTVAAGVGTLTYTAASSSIGALSGYIEVGQLIHVGGTTSGRQFSAGIGYGRVTAVTATTVTLDKLDSTLATDPGTGETVDLLFGRFLKNVDVDDASFLERSFQFEAAYPDLASVGVDEYEYSKGNRANTMALSLPLADKSTVTFGFVGTDTDVPTVTRKTNAASAVDPLQTTAFNTSSDIARLRLLEDTTGLTTCFKDVTLTLNNNVTPEKCLGTLGAFALNSGIFQVDLEAQVLFTNSEVVTAVRNNTTVTMDFIITNDNGAVAFDIPSMTIGGGDKELPVNESVIINLSGQAFQDATFGTSIGISLFPIVP